MTLGQFTEPMLLVPRLLSETQASAINELAKRLHRADRIDNTAAFIDPIMKREASVPTLIGEGVALPHARGSGVSTLSLAVGLSTQGIPWPGTDALVHVVFLSAIPFAETQQYLGILEGLSKLIQHPVAFDNLKSAARAEQMQAVLGSIALLQRPSSPVDS